MQQTSRETLDLAILIALELDMHKRDSARLWGEGDPVLEEAWRRTWYMLAISDQHFAIVMNTPLYQLADMPCDVYLPCDDEYYITGVSKGAYCLLKPTDFTANTNPCHLPGNAESRVRRS